MSRKPRKKRKEKLPTPSELAIIAAILYASHRTAVWSEQDPEHYLDHAMELYREASRRLTANPDWVDA